MFDAKASAFAPGVEQDRLLRALDQAENPQSALTVGPVRRVVVEDGDAQRARREGRRSTENCGREEQPPGHLLPPSVQ